MGKKSTDKINFFGGGDDSTEGGAIAILIFIFFPIIEFIVENIKIVIFIVLSTIVLFKILKAKLRRKKINDKLR